MNNFNLIGIIKLSFCFLIIVVVFNACSTSKTGLEESDSGSEIYTSVFPSREASSELELISKSIKLINNLTFYKSYIFLDSTITRDNLADPYLLSKAILTNTVNKTSSGTGTIIGISGTKVALLTSAHIVSYKDTVLNFYFDKRGMKTKYIESILIKERQLIYSDLPESGRLKLIVKDDKKDLAIVGNSFNDVNPIDFPVFNFNIGSARDLNWGSFVYVLGFPLHYKMVTRAIVSSPNKDDMGRFLIDALINRGSSGGLVLAVRGTVPNFELVGIVSSVPAEKKYVLTPMDPNKENVFFPGQAYDGDISIDKIDGIKYGIGKVTSIEEVKLFLEENEAELINQGYNFSFE